MPLKPKRVENTSRGGLKSPVLEADNYPARLVQVIDLGLQQNFFDKDKTNHQVMLTYELTTEFCLDENDEEVKDKPRWLSETINMIDLPVDMTVDEIYNDQYRGKAKMVLRARAFDKKGSLDFDLSQMLGMPCALTVVTKKKKNSDELKNEVGAVNPPMRGMQIEEVVNEPKFFSLEEPDLEIFKSLPEWLQEKIKGNLEYNGSALQKLLAGGQSETNQDKPEPQQEEEDDDEKPW